ncbi:autotransporter outer membrane beta-barrel domain-containing protein [Fibrobacter sp.]|uniref:autotransporter outer membrane beta-barrel domain-containing protein n=1 Tax=Fibrobacter sp. TaxID=35828 RepID=UPI0025C3892E|nr:autotransporter outer membrane beta-barrel domain-containing protein [Fibrobacter sp.]
MLCLVVYAKPKAKTASKPQPKAAVEDEFDESGFESAPSADDADDDEDDEGAAPDESSLTASQKQDLAARKKFEEEQRLDEYANSLRRRNWLKDRLVFQIGMGSRYPFMGETGMGMGFGIGAEYITRWGIALYGSGGLLPKGNDNDFEGIQLDGGYGYKVGLNYYLFPKNPLHLGISASYGTVYFDHNVEPNAENIRPLITVDGFQFDVLITYLTNEWYYLQFSVGMYYAPKLAKDTPEENPSLRYQSTGSSKIISSVVNPDGMSKTGIVFGISIGYALPELFPDDTEKRRRQREKERERK